MQTDSGLTRSSWNFSLPRMLLGDIYLHILVVVDSVREGVELS